MTLRFFWLLLNLSALCLSGAGFVFACVDFWRIYTTNTNGEQRRTANKHLINYFVYLVTITAFLALTIAAFLQPWEPRSDFWANLGIVLLFTVSINIAFASSYNLLHRAEDFRVAKRVDTDSDNYDEAKKNPRWQGLKSLTRKSGCLEFGRAMILQA